MKLKKSLYLMLCTVLIIAISACAKIQEPSTNIPNTDVMLVVTSSFVGTDSDGESGAIVSQWVLYYDGLLEYKSEATGGRSIIKTITLSEKDVNAVETILKSQKDASDETIVMDGISWNLKYYDPDGNVLSKYDGYLHEGNDYEQLYRLLNEYVSR